VPLAPGDVFAGYTVIRMLGRGGMGAVYLVRHPRLPRSDALKLLRAELSADPDFAARFLHEADVVAGLSHRNIVPVLDRGEAEGQLWLTMPFVDGTDAERALKDAGGTLPPRRVAHIVTEIAAALDSAHRHHLVHRDVKPANILLAASADPDEPEQVFLTDFGIAKSLDSASKLTRTGAVVATFDYASPEQLESRPVGPWSDVYSLGGVLHRLLTGSVPYPGDSLAAAVHGHVSLPPPRPTSLAPWLPPGIDDVVTRAMAKNPADRYPNCRALAAAAAQVLSAAPVREAPFPATVPVRGKRAPAAATPAPADTDARSRQETERLDPEPPTPVSPPATPLPPPPRRPQLPSARPAAPPAQPERPPTEGPPPEGPPTEGPLLLPVTARTGPFDVQRRTGTRWVVAGVVAAVVVAVAGAFWLFGGDDDPGSDGASGSSSGATTSATPSSIPGLPAGDPLAATTLVAPRTKAGDTDLYLVDTTTGQTLEQVTSEARPDTAPLLSPDRRTIAYVQLAADGASTLRVVGSDGSGDRPMFTTPPPGCRTVFRPAWNPVDGTQLALVCLGADGRYALRIVTVTGEVVRELDVGAERFDDVSWSPDGSTLVYWAASGPTGAGLVRQAADGSSAPQRLTAGGNVDDGDAVWSPDGARIAFRRVSGSESDIYVMNADGSGVRALLTVEGFEQDPTWSPDGSQLAFKSDRAGASGAGNHVWVMNADGSNAVQLPTGAEGIDDSAPAWGPR
jgi:serine/threonine protein kinase